LETSAWDVRPTPSVKMLLGDASLLTKYSAVQIRIGGAKGMLAAWPSMTRNQVVLRDSMLKYESKHEKFGAVMVRSLGSRRDRRSMLMH
jgi:hypothetical protein